VLGRADLQGEVRHHTRGAAASDRTLQHEHPQRGRCHPRQRHEGGQVRDHAGDVHLPRRVRRGRARLHRGTRGYEEERLLEQPLFSECSILDEDQGRRAGARLHGAGQEGERRVRPRRGEEGARVPRGLVRHPVPAAQVRPHRHPGLRDGRHGELGPRHLSRYAHVLSTYMYGPSL